MTPPTDAPPLLPLPRLLLLLPGAPFASPSCSSGLAPSFPAWKGRRCLNRLTRVTLEDHAAAEAARAPHVLIRRERSAAAGGGGGEVAAAAVVVVAAAAGDEAAWCGRRRPRCLLLASEAAAAAAAGSVGVGPRKRWQGNR